MIVGQFTHTHTHTHTHFSHTSHTLLTHSLAVRSRHMAKYFGVDMTTESELVSLVRQVHTYTHARARARAHTHSHARTHVLPP